jgi:hypothetical protein
VEFSSALPDYTGRTTSRVCDCVGGAHALKMEHSSCESRFLRVDPAKRLLAVSPKQEKRSIVAANVPQGLESGRPVGQLARRALET